MNRCKKSKSLVLSVLYTLYGNYKENLIVGIVYFSNILLTFRQ